jgi:thiol:disulfide interchange protein
MFKRLVIFFTLLIAVITVSAQQSDSVVNWQFSGIQQQEGQYILQLKAAIQPGWKLFSTTMSDDEPNTRVIVDSSLLSNAGKLSETGKLHEAKEPLFDNSRIRYFENELTIELPLKDITPGTDIKAVVSYMALKGENVVGPEEVPLRFKVDANGKITTAVAGLVEKADASNSLKRNAIDLNHPASDCGGTGGENTAGKSLWSIFVLGFIGGLIGLIMPCTFPMIPLTVSFFTKKAKSRSKGILNAFTYGFFIFLIYVLLSIPFYFLDSGSADILNNISTNAWLNIFFAVVFFVFALSFFGLFEIALPSSVTNKVDERSDMKSLGGIFFMALTLAIVSFSCTGPILGSLLVGALNQNGGAVQLTVAMSGFGVALGLPFALFALFPNWLSGLPRSGAWMNTVKIVFAFIELALMIKFLSNADLVMHWGLLKRETFFLIWIVISIATSLYLFGLLKFKHDPPPKKLSTGRIALAVLFLLFGIYLAPGLSNTKYANRALISGFPPPLTYSIYGEKQSKGKGVEANVVNDYEKALQLAKEQGKPLLIDFTGWACVNCRKMEENVWTKPEVKELIEKDFILVSLFVDDRKLLPEAEQFIYTNGKGAKKEIKTVGDKFATFQTENFHNASQPLYVILSADEKLLTKPIGYTPDVEKYVAWLQCGLKK